MSSTQSYIHVTYLHMTAPLLFYLILTANYVWQVYSPSSWSKLPNPSRAEAFSFIQIGGMYGW